MPLRSSEEELSRDYKAYLARRRGPMPREGMLIDPKCHALAVHFLNSDATPAMKQELAEWIQHHVELWLYDDKGGAQEAAETLGAV